MGHETKEGFVVKWNDQSGRFIKVVLFSTSKALAGKRRVDGTDRG